MAELTHIDRSTMPATIHVPRDYNAAIDFIDRNLEEGRGAKVAVRDDGGEYTYAQVAERVNRAGNALLGLGLATEHRVMMCMLATTYGLSDISTPILAMGESIGPMQ